jgi:hypothetical protein
MEVAGTTTSRTRVIRTLNHEAVDRAPRDLWIAPAVELSRGDEVAEMRYRYPCDLARCDLRSAKGNRSKGLHEPGEHTDAWGCVWHVADRFATPELRHSPLANLAALAHYRLPWDSIGKAKAGAVERGGEAASRFVLAMSEVRPFERLQWLHGRESTLRGLASGEKPLCDLLDAVHDFYAREIDLWGESEADGVALGDGWGSPDGLVVSPQVWRELFLPLYREYCEILRGKDKFVFFQTSGNVAEILEDLVEIGVDAVHAPLHQMDLERIAERFRNRLTFWGGADPNVLATGRADDIRGSIRRVRAALDFGRGGLIAQCEWASGLSFNQVSTAMEAWQAPLPMHVQR